MEEKSENEPLVDEKTQNRTVFVPKAEISLSEDNGFRIVLDKKLLAGLFDQSIAVQKMRGQGCMSAPGGPSC